MAGVVEEEGALGFGDEPVHCGEDVGTCWVEGTWAARSSEDDHVPC